MSSLPLGSIATNLTSDRKVLIVALSVLASLNPDLAAKHRDKRVVIKAEGEEDLSVMERYQLGRVVKSLISDLNHHVPPFSYCGYQPNDPAHLGVWVDLGALHEAEVKGRLTQVVGASWRGVKTPYILALTDGALTLYRRRDRAVIWSV